MKAQEKIKARGDHLLEEDSEEEAQFIRMMPTSHAVIDDETKITDDDERLMWMRIPFKQRATIATKAKMIVKSNAEPQLPSSPSFPQPEGPTLDDMDPSIPRLPNPFKSHRMSRRPGSNAPLISRNYPPEWSAMNRRDKSMEVNVPVPPPLSSGQIQDIIDQKVELLRDEVKLEFDITKSFLEVGVAEVEQDKSKIIELGIRLKISEEQKEEYKEIQKLQAEVKTLNE